MPIFIPFITERRNRIASLACLTAMLIAPFGLAQTQPSPAPSNPASVPAATSSPAVAPAMLPPQQAYIVIDPATGRPMTASGQYTGLQRRPATLPYEDGEPIPRGYVVRESNLSGLVIGGIIPLSIFYLISFSVASNNSFRGPAGWLAVPVIGPFGWLATHKANHCTGDVCIDPDDVIGRTFVTMDGIFQTAGAAMFIAGLAITRKRLVLIENQEMYVVPYASSTLQGLSILGSF